MLSDTSMDGIPSILTGLSDVLSRYFGEDKIFFVMSCLIFLVREIPSMTGMFISVKMRGYTLEQSILWDFCILVSTLLNASTPEYAYRMNKKDFSAAYYVTFNIKTVLDHHL